MPAKAGIQCFAKYWVPAFAGTSGPKLPRRALFPRRIGVDRERVHAALQFARERRVDHAVALDPALPLKRLRHNIDPEMRLPARTVSGVAFMLVGFIDNAQAFRCESLRQLLRDDVGGSHRFRLGSRSGSLSC